MTVGAGNKRLVFLLALAGSWLFGLVFRLYDLQVLRHAVYAERALRQQQRVVVLDPPRGTIYDARDRELAVSLKVDSVAADPSHVNDPEATAAAIARVLGLEPARQQRLRDELASSCEFVWVARKLDPQVSDEIRALDLDGVFLLPENKRYYPLRHLAAQVLGYVGTDREGLAGLEYLYDRVVASQQGRRTVVRDARLGTVLYPHQKDLDAARPGKDLHLTLDAAIQHIVESELDAAMAEHGAVRGSVVLMDPRSGAILALASRPTFDPNRFADFPAQSWRNQPVMDAFEPGSTFKMVTLAAALEAGEVASTDVFDCEMGGVVMHRVRINDHKAFGELSVRQILAKSSNVGAIKLGRAAGTDRLFATIRAFGFGDPTGVDLPSESAGILRPVGKWSALTPAYVSFGQGISVTGLQMARAFAAIANGGRLVEPHIVAAIDEPAGKRLREHESGDLLPIAPSTIAQIRSILESVVTEGTAKSAAIDGYRVAGKTGTAQKAGRGGYLRGKYIASFVGFAPVERPAVVCLVALDEPWPRYHGGDSAAPIFQKIVSQVLLYLGVEPTPRSHEHWPGETPTPRLAVDRLELGPQLVAAVDELSQPVLATPPGTMPDFVGLSARQAVTRSSEVGIRLALHGRGRVVRQIPAPGTSLEEVDRSLELWLTESM